MNEREEHRNLQERRWEAQVNAMIDGDLAPAMVRSLLEEARSNPALDAMVNDAQRLKAMLDEVPRLQAPAHLRDALQEIPVSERGSTLTRVKPYQWAIAASLVATVLITSLVSNDRQEVELELARQELAIAFDYLRRSSQKTPMLIASSVDDAAIQPITENTIRTLSGQMIR
jgi:hypothetical protein